MTRHALPALALAFTLSLLPLTGAAAHHSTTRSPASGATATALALAQRDQRALAAARPGLRDLYDLTRRLKLRRAAPVDPYVRTVAPDYAVGRTDTFYIAKATSGYTTTRLTILLKTPHAYWYVSPDTGIPRDRLLASLRASAQVFEAHVYPTDHSAFGREWTPGIDRDPRLTILCLNLAGSGAGGYYSAEDLYPRVVNAYSNERKTLYVGIDSYPLGTAGFAATLAHEFQHMIHWYRHERDDAWINEGASMLAQVLNGYTADGLDQSFAAAPATQLDAFCYEGSPCADTSSAAHYGAAFQWMLYLYQHDGGDRALRTLLADTGLSGMALFDDVLARLGSRDRARDLFARFALANFVDDPTIAGGVYGYRPTYAGCCIRAAVTASATAYPYTRRATVHQFATDYVEVRPATAPGTATVRLRFAGDPTVRIVPNTPPGGGTEWWSNRGDEMDNTLTRALDLTRVRHATLRYDMWYDVEKDFDYGYVEASTDNGRTWRTLPAPHTTDADPNGASYGNGYTGQSATVAGNAAGWLHERIDLSPYAGQRVLVRFEHITDDAFNAAGLTLATIRVPEIGFADRLGTTGWQTGGWVRIANTLPTRWLLGLVLYTTHGVVVRPLSLAPDATGTATITGLGRDVRRAVVAISPTAPQTTIPSGYTLTVR
jgi:immune inhibitor A